MLVAPRLAVSAVGTDAKSGLAAMIAAEVCCWLEEIAQMHMTRHAAALSRSVAMVLLLFDSSSFRNLR